MRGRALGILALLVLLSTACTARDRGGASDGFECGAPGTGTVAREDGCYCLLGYVQRPDGMGCEPEGGTDAGFDPVDAGMDRPRDAGSTDAHTPTDAHTGSDSGCPSPGAEWCNGLDDDCDGTVDGPGCAAAAGRYAGTYEIYTAERLGSTIINEMRCTGSSSAEVDLAATPPLSGTVECHYGGGLVAFGSEQSGTLEGRVRPDGSVEGTVSHQFDPSDSGTRRTFSFRGTITGGRLEITGTSSWRPNPRSAVPWDVELSASGS